MSRNTIIKKNYYFRLLFIIGFLIIAVNKRADADTSLQYDLSNAVIVVDEGLRPAAEKMAAEILEEEVYKHTGLSWPVSTEAEPNNPVIVMVKQTTKNIAAMKISDYYGNGYTQFKVVNPEGILCFDNAGK